MTLLNILIFLITNSSMISKAAEKCVVCDFKPSELSKTPGKADACEDLFKASCMSADGQMKNKDLEKSQVERVFQDIRKARDEAAKKYGFKNAREGLLAKLKTAGIELKDPIDETVVKSLMKEPVEENIYDLGRGMADVNRCQKEQESLSQYNYYQDNNVEALKAHLTKAKEFEATQRERIISANAQDIPGFFTRELSGKCATIKSSKDSYPEALNPEIYKTCAKLIDLKLQASKVYRAEGTPEYQQMALQFVTQNFPGDLKAAPYGAGYPATPAPGASSRPSPTPLTEDMVLKSQIGDIRNTMGSKCYSLSGAQTEVAKKISSDYLDSLARAKPAVDHMISSVYTADRKKKIDQLFPQIRSDVQGLTRSLVKDPAKRGKILEGYDQISFHWMEKPQSNLFTNNKLGIPELKVDDNTSLEPADTAFNDGSLTYFTTYNAFYNPKTQAGEYVMKEKVTMMPRFVALMDENPFAFMAVLAHEVGHKIGPNLSTINGHSTKSEFKDLLACYKDGKSIKMEDQQQDETISDYVSSEILAHEIKKLPVEQRKLALTSALESLCGFSNTSGNEYHFSCNGTHPFAPLRIAGVYGANPKLRKVVGCEGEAKDFKSCGMNISVLEPSTTEEAFGETKGGTR